MYTEMTLNSKTIARQAIAHVKHKSEFCFVPTSIIDHDVYVKNSASECELVKELLERATLFSIIELFV